MIKRASLMFFLLLSAMALVNAQWNTEADTLPKPVIKSGWADEAVTIGYITAPSVLGLMFVSSLVGEWNAGYLGIPASVMIFTAPPLIYLGGRSVPIPKELNQPRAKLGWTLYALSIVPTGLALYGFTTDWGATLPLTIASGVLGTASIIAMTSYAYGRSEYAGAMAGGAEANISFGIIPVHGGAIASLTYSF